MTINGQARLFKLDTGGVITSIFPEAVEDLKLRTRRTTQVLIDTEGKTSRTSAHADMFNLGGIRTDSGLNFMVLPSRNPGYANNRRAGYLALDMLKKYDIELDFAASTMNLFSPDHCDGHVVYWPAQTVAEIPLTFDGQGKPRIPVKLDGVELSAVIDTGSVTTFLNISVGTRRLSLDLDAPDVQKIGPEGRTIYRKRFQTLDMNGILVASPFVTMLPDKMGETVRATTNRPVTENLRLPDLLIGTSILNKLRVYIATKEKKLYITAAEPPSANADPAPQIPGNGT